MEHNLEPARTVRHWERSAVPSAPPQKERGIFPADPSPKEVAAALGGLSVCSKLAGTYLDGTGSSVVLDPPPSLTYGMLAVMPLSALVLKGGVCALKPQERQLFIALKPRMSCSGAPVKPGVQCETPIPRACSIIRLLQLSKLLILAWINQ